MAFHLLIDGYNVLAPIAGPGRSPDPSWLHRERMLLLDRLREYLPRELLPGVCVVFDANNPPRDRPSHFKHHEITVQFAVAYQEADDLIEELIECHSAPKRLAVVSSDRRIQTAARRRGAATFESAPWIDDLVDGRPGLADFLRRSGRRNASLPLAPSDRRSHPDDRSKKFDVADVDVDMWLSEFGFKTPE